MFSGGRRVVGAIYLLGATAYLGPWLRGLRGPTDIVVATIAVVLALAVAFAAWTARSRRPTLVSVGGALLTTAVITMGPMLVATRSASALLPMTSRTILTFVIAFSLGIVLARPASWAGADRSSAHAGVWLMLVGTPPLGLATFAYRLAPGDLEAIFGLVVSAAIVFFGLVVSVSGARGAPATRPQWVAEPLSR